MPNFPDIEVRLVKEADVITLAGQECSICLSSFVFRDEIAGTRCKHLFHAACLDDWFSIVC